MKRRSLDVDALHAKWAAQAEAGHAPSFAERIEDVRFAQIEAEAAAIGKLAPPLFTGNMKRFRRDLADWTEFGC